MATLQDDNAFTSDAILGPRRLVVNTGESHFGIERSGAWR
jgi:hypothetical protein